MVSPAVCPTAPAILHPQSGPSRAPRAPLGLSSLTSAQGHSSEPHTGPLAHSTRGVSLSLACGPRPDPHLPPGGPAWQSWAPTAQGPRPRGVVMVGASLAGCGPQFWEPSRRSAADMPPHHPPLASTLPRPSPALLPMPSGLLSGLAGPLPPVPVSSACCVCPVPATVLRWPFWRDRGAPEACGDPGPVGGCLPAGRLVVARSAPRRPWKTGGGGGLAWKRGCQASLRASSTISLCGQACWAPRTQEEVGMESKWPHLRSKAGVRGWAAPPSLGRMVFLGRVEIPSLDSCLTSPPSRVGPTRASHNG